MLRCTCVKCAMFAKLTGQRHSQCTALSCIHFFVCTSCDRKTLSLSYLSHSPTPFSCTLLCGFVSLSRQSIRISCMIPTVPQMHAPSHPPKHQDRKQTTKARIIYKSIIRLNSFAEFRMQMNPVKFEMNLLHLL